MVDLFKWFPPFSSQQQQRVKRLGSFSFAPPRTTAITTLQQIARLHSNQKTDKQLRRTYNMGVDARSMMMFLPCVCGNSASGICSVASITSFVGIAKAATIWWSRRVTPGLGQSRCVRRRRCFICDGYCSWKWIFRTWLLLQYPYQTGWRAYWRQMKRLEKRLLGSELSQCWGCDGKQR